MLAEFVKVIPRTRAMALITYRPHYRGALAQVPGAQTVALDPLGDADTSALVAELLGADASVGAVAELIAERITRYAAIVGRENVIASTDCGFSSQASYKPEVDPRVMWAKFDALAEGARIASERLWT